MHGLSFPPSARIRTAPEYDRVFKAGKPFHTSGFKVVMAAGEAGWSRLGLVVSRRVGPAVVRNHIKRRLREWFRQCRGTFPRPLDIVVVAKPSSATFDYGRIAGEMDSAVGRWRENWPSAS